MATMNPASHSQEHNQWLVDVANKRCQNAFKRLFDNYSGKLFHFAMKQHLSEAVAKELTQETLMLVWHKAHLFDADKGCASTWIYTIARNLRFDYLRKYQQRSVELYSDELWPIINETHADEDTPHLDSHVQDDELNTMLTQLPDSQRSVLEAIYLLGKTQQEVADEMALPLGTVKSRVRLGLEKLKQMMEAV